MTVLRRQPWPERKGLDRMRMARNIWAQDFDVLPETDAEKAEDQRVLEAQIERTAAAVAKLRTRGVPGIHFQDYPELQGYDLPEWSHMTQESADRYTAALYNIIAKRVPPTDGSRW
jgi:hypothetical protein